MIEEADCHVRWPELVADAVPLAIVAVDLSGALAMANSAARRSLGLSDLDLGRPFRELELSACPDELCSAVEHVQKDERSMVLGQGARPGGPGTTDCFEIHVVPVSDPTGTVHGVALTFIDASSSRRLQDELDQAKSDLESVDETMQSTIKELEAANQELQSSNEALGALNAALDSTDEELQILNDDLRMRTRDLEEVNQLLASLLVSQRGGLVVIDSDLRVAVWNDQSADLWGLRPEEAPGQHFLNLDIGLPVEELRRPIEAILRGASDRETVDIDATTRRGREFRCRVSLTPLVSRKRKIWGAILLMEDASGGLVPS